MLATRGLRTLCIAAKSISSSTASAWLAGVHVHICGTVWLANVRVYDLRPYTFICMCMCMSMSMHMRMHMHMSMYL